MPIRPDEFDGLAATPYLDENGGRARVAYSFRASAVRAPQRAGSGKPAPRANSGEAA